MQSATTQINFVRIRMNKNVYAESCNSELLIAVSNREVAPLVVLIITNNW